MYAYVAVFVSILLGNSIYWIKYRGKWWMLAYELVSGSYLVAMIIIYFSDSLSTGITRWITLPTVAIIIADFYLSMWGRTDILTPDGLEVSENEFEVARIISVIFAAPAYIIAGLLLAEKWFGV